MNDELDSPSPESIDALSDRLDRMQSDNESADNPKYDRIIGQFRAAHESGNIELIASIWQKAAKDPVLGRILMDIENELDTSTDDANTDEPYVDQDDAAEDLQSESVDRFLKTAKSIIENGKTKAEVGQALNTAWLYYINESSTLNRATVRVINRIKDTFPLFRPSLLESTSMRYFGKSMRPETGGHDQPTEMKEHGSVDEKLRGKPKNTADCTPCMPGTAKGLGEGKLKNLNLNIMKENVSKLASNIRKAIREGASGLRGPHKVNFTILVTEGKWKNRTKARKKMAEAVADLEEVLQFHPVEDVVLEAWYIKQNGKIAHKQDINTVAVRGRGPIVSEGSAIFRFKRNAEKFAGSLNESGVSCRLKKHNWGAAVSSRVTMEHANHAFATISEARSWSEWWRQMTGRGQKGQAPAPTPQAPAPTAQMRRSTPQPAQAPSPDFSRLAASSAQPQARMDMQRLAASAAPPPAYAGPTSGGADADDAGWWATHYQAKAAGTAPGRGKMRRTLTAALTGAMQQLSAARQALTSLQSESRLRRTRMMHESDLGDELDSLLARDPSRAIAKPAAPKVQAGAGAAIQRELASIASFPDEYGNSPQDLQKLQSILTKYLQMIKSTNVQLARIASNIGVTGLQESRSARRAILELKDVSANVTNAGAALQQLSNELRGLGLPAAAQISGLVDNIRAEFTKLQSNIELATKAKDRKSVMAKRAERERSAEAGRRAALRSEEHTSDSSHEWISRMPSSA